ncbi:TonB-dependent receptor [Granulicella mallensis]|uniref:TonB-dependent receptor, plug n=1 Tax=Granulicella mallensis (strain ATCC BAA-1857 / DSM 23137 / MP5ACTX8) TaxID=682795 RepID=G8NQ14_GRAMM|nr:TonB-dependent receptor [Granulicella mallensis]AEU38348.1 TonB-dependent receptor, plug [Granulicella mallensis MP5ACTX8]
MKKKLFQYLAGCVLALLVGLPAAFAQTVTGSISGTVFDPSGAAVPGASVTAINAGTGVRTPTTSNADGVYAIRFLPIGPYTLEVQAKGFAKFSIPQFTLEINQNAKLDAHVNLGTSTSVEVQEDVAPILDTTDATLGLSLDATAINTIPLNGRNFSSLTLFQPGAVSTAPTGLTGNNAIQRNAFNSGVVTINGNRAQDNTYTLDGISIDETQNNLIGYNPSPDALQEVRVISANAPAQYGNVNGGDIVSVLKSGTNQFHGSLYDYVEDQNFTANTWSNNFQGVAKTAYTQNLFGATLGGPILKDKLFFFIDYTGTRNHGGGPGAASVLSAAERQGNFSAAALKYQIVDPQNGYKPFPGGIVPITNPVVQYLINNPQFYPLPNHTPTDGLDQNNFIGPMSDFVTNDQGDVKIQYNLRAADQITAFYSQGVATGGSVAPLPITFPIANSYPDKIGGVTWTHTFSPNIVNEARFGFTRIRWDSNIPTDSTGAFGLQGDHVVGIPTPAPQQFVGFTFQSTSEITSVGDPAAPQQLRDNTFSLHDDLTIQRGRHLFTVGAQLLRYQQNFTQFGGGGQLGTYNFTGQNTAPVNAALLYSPADWVTDRANGQSISLSNGFFGERQVRLAGYVQDDWKITDKLTLNLGIRYEYDSPFTEVHDRIANVILSGPQQGLVEYAGSVPAGAPAGSFTCSNAACYQPTYTEFQPRIGFAYQVNPRIVFRGGYGTTSFLEGSSSLAANAPFTTAFSINSTAPVSQTNPGNFFAETNGFQVGAPGQMNNASYTAYNQNYRQAYVQEFNFNNEIQLNNSTSIQFGYVGELSQRLIDYRNGNQLTPTQAASLTALGLNSGSPAASIPVADRAPLFNLVGENGTVETFDTEGVASYNALQITMRHRVSKGFQATINYTWAKSLTDTNGNFGAADSSGPNAIQDGYNIHGDYGPSELDVRHNLAANGSYKIPFGRGEIFGSHTNRALDLVAGGWTLSSTAIAFSGLPVTITANDNSNTGNYNNNSSRANQYRPLKIVNRSVAHWFGTDPSATPCETTDNGICAYGAAAPNTFGTAHVGTERAPGFEQIDSSLFKDFHITSAQAISFRVDAFNIFNFVSYDNPSNSVSNANFGQITSSKNGPRTVQFALHYAF